ncbi:MAG: SelT/SelW/SelH family protein [Gammaproteobacteria bacterium]|nr:SelT/SelW/SelH family protein [Gammaproteobacteria bacterium]
MQKPVRIEVEYCTGCHWLLRAAWIAQELLSTFEQDIGEVALVPGSVGGIFEVRVNGEVIWSRKERGHFPEAKELKQILRDRIAPGRDLGHIDGPVPMRDQGAVDR